MTGSIPAAPGSLLEQLRQGKEQKLQQLELHHEVPHTDHDNGLGSVWLRFRPIEDKRAGKYAKKLEKSKDAEANLRYNASLIGEFCTGIYRVLHGEKVSVDADDPDGDFPTFSSIAESANCNVADVVRAVFVTDGSIHSCAALLTEWSDYRKADEAESHQGE